MALDDLDPEMPRDPLDDATADRLLAGSLLPDDAPPGYAQVAALITAARGSGDTTGMASRQAAVSAMTAVIASRSGTSSSPRRRESRRMFSKLLTLKALGVALPAVALTAGSAAAATGSLPTPAQSAVSSALSNVGIHVPNGHSESSAPSNAVGPDATGAAKYGLCTAAQANAGHASSKSVAFANLQKAATAAGETVTQYCAGVTPPSENGTNDQNGSNKHGKSGQNGADTNGSDNANNHSDSTPSGPPSSTPASGTTPVSTPAGPPTSTPASGSTPPGPPSSTPASGH